MKLQIADNLREAFNSIGKRFTSQRQRIWEVFNENVTGLTITQAVDLLKNEGIGHTTVYRTVKEFTGLGFLKWVHAADGEHRYVSSLGGHCHPLVCRVCGKVQLVDCQGMSTLQKLIAVETGFLVEGHYLEIFGRCPDCR
jgi:Fe2+ or Zn2+ uptake regulation protein